MSEPKRPPDASSAPGGAAVAERAKPKTGKPRVKKPPRYKVLMHNDDYTPMEFVVFLLIQFFNMSQAEAERITLHIHTRGKGLCGVFPREIAETKVRMTMEFARKNEHPLQCTMERE